MYSEFECQINRLSHEGRGIASVAGKATFVVGALPGEQVRAIMTKKHGRYDEARALEVLGTPSVDRAEPLCSAFGVCGGCNLQHLSHEAQIAHKQQALLEQLANIGRVEKPTLAPAVVGDGSYHYRTKARLGVRYVPKKGGALVGFREQSSNKLTVMDACPILAKPVCDLITPLKGLIESLSAPDSIAQIEVAVADNETALIFRHMQALTPEDQTQLRVFAAAHGISVFLQPKGPDSVHRLEASGDERGLNYHLPEFKLTYWYQPLDFTQINVSVNQKMVRQACEWLDVQPEDSVLDLFCGLGNFSLAIAGTAKHVLGIEGSAPMIGRARVNAEYNGIQNASFEVQDLSVGVSSQAWAKGNYDKVLLDPSRSGAQDVVTQLATMSVKKIVYVSCQPASLARDTQILLASGRYRLVKVGLLDMFPHTPHAEAMALFELI